MGAIKLTIKDYKMEQNDIQEILEKARERKEKRKQKIEELKEKLNLDLEEKNDTSEEK